MRSKEIDWILTECINESNEYTSHDIHIFAVDLHNILIKKGYKIVKIEENKHEEQENLNKT